MSDITTDTPEVSSPKKTDHLFPISGSTVLLDLAILSLVAAALAAIYYGLPLDFQIELAFDHSELDPITFWTSSFVHAHISGDLHLLSNLLMYSVTVTLAWALYVFHDDRQAFWRGLAFLFVIGPPIFSATSYIGFDVLLGASVGIDRGFSGIVGGIIGMLTISIVAVLEQALPKERAWYGAGLYLSVVSGGLAVSISLPLIRWTMATAFVTCLVILGCSVYTGRIEPGWMVSWATEHRLHAAILLCGVVASTFGFMVAFPGEITNAGRTTNVFSHGAGLILGLFVGGRFKPTSNSSE